MSQFRKRLTDLFASAYGTDTNELKDSRQSFASNINDKSKMQFSFRNNQQTVPIGQSKHSVNQSRSNSNANSFYESKPSTSQSFLRKRGITTDILNDSAISPLYTEKSSFSQLQTDTSFNSQIISYRLNSRNKHYSRIKKEIDTLSRSFKESIVVQNNLNRPVVALNKPEYQNFSINYVSSIASIKERSRENRYKKKDQQYVAYPSSNSFMMNCLKRNEMVANGKTNQPTKPKIALKNDLNDLYDYINQQKKKH